MEASLILRACHSDAMPEVSQLYSTVAVDEDVLGFDISVDEMALVEVKQPEEDLPD